jgi:anthranilate synthase component 1
VITPFEQFVEFSKQGNVVPIVDDLLADTDTPVSAYLKIADESRYSFLLESVEGGEKIARYSFLGFDPFMLFEARGREYSVHSLRAEFQVIDKLLRGGNHPLSALKKIFAHFKAVAIPGLPRFSGGAVGYFGYETIQLVEDIPTVRDEGVSVPDMMLMFFDSLLVFDNLQRKIFVIVNSIFDDTGAQAKSLRPIYDRAVERLHSVRIILGKTVSADLSPASGKELRYNTSREQYQRKVERGKEYILDGDIFQVVLSQRADREVSLKPFDLYRMLRIINPSPYLYFLKADTLQIIGSSPEMLVRVEGRVVETRPIAGTRPRGTTPEEDDRLGLELLADEKERAEHLMLVDLGRNDIGRISDFGTVEVSQFMAIEKYSHVMHIVSNVRGRLRKDVTAIDALYSCFPAGTLTGAPKIRAMQIIAELEATRRGIYGGAIGYVDFSGNLDSCIAIRTIVIKDGVARFQAGAGIVADSVPEREYQETLDKLAANLSAVKMLIDQPSPRHSDTAPPIRERGRG